MLLKPSNKAIREISASFGFKIISQLIARKGKTEKGNKPPALRIKVWHQAGKQEYRYYNDVGINKKPLGEESEPGGHCCNLGK